MLICIACRNGAYFAIMKSPKANAKGYFDAADSADARYEAKKAMNAQRTKDYQSGSCARAGGVVDPLPEDAPFFVKDYYDYYKTQRG